MHTDPSALLAGDADTTAAVAAALVAMAQSDDGVSFLDPVRDLGLRDLDAVTGLDEARALRRTLTSSKCSDCPLVRIALKTAGLTHCTLCALMQLGEHFRMARERAAITTRLALLRASLDDRNLSLMPEFDAMLDVLERLSYCDGRRSVALKGRAACEVNAGHVRWRHRCGLSPNWIPYCCFRS